MLTNWLTYRAVARALHGRIAGFTVGLCYTQEKNELVVELSRGSEEAALRFSARPHAPGLQLPEASSRARRNTAELFPELAGAEVLSVQMAAGDRMMRLALSGDRALVMFFHATRANACAMHGDGLTAFFKRRHVLPLAGVSWDGTEMPVLPPAETFRSALFASGTIAASYGTIAASLRRLRPWLSGVLAEEIVLRSGLLADVNPAALDENHAEALYAAAVQVLGECESGRATIVSTQEGLERLLLFRPSRLEEGRHVSESDLLPALDLIFRGARRSENLHALKSAVLRAVDREEQRLRQRLERAPSEAETAQRSAELERCGTLLLANIGSVARGLDSVALADIFQENAPPLVIALKPALTTQENAEHYFTRARSLRASVERTRTRMARTRAALGTLETFRPRIAAAENVQELRGALRESPELLKRLGMEQTGKESAPFPFRRFHVAGGFEVWVGKNSAGNDELTLRHSKPNDLWFHARGVGGSHAVLKVDSAPGDPGRDSIREAAAIAAWYSKYRKAKHIPVVYTERKYVRKPKGVPAGTVVLMREKVVMVDPKLPAGEDDEAEDAG